MRLRPVVQRQRAGDELRGLLGDAGDENGADARAMHGGGDAENLLRRLARAVDDLRRALTKCAVQIDLRVAKILKRRFFELELRLLHGNGAVFHGLQQFMQMFVHGRTSRSSITAL